jgi:hypothetical protein
MWRRAGLAAAICLFVVLILGASLWCTAARVGSAGLARVYLESTPGLIVQGHVWLDREGGDGLAGVDIYRSYASYPGTVVATTEADGFYQSEFAFIPVDETSSVWAELDGHTFEPPLYFWRHYYGFEVATLDFVATAPYSCYLPFVCRTISSDIRVMEAH